MTELIDEAISTYCKKHGHPEWEKPLIDIIAHYEGYPLDYLEDNPKQNILKILKEYKLQGNAFHDTGMFAWDVARLSVFCNQAYVRLFDKKKIIPWNPLEQSYSDFTKDHPEHERLSVEEGYPPENHIRMWFYMQVK